MLRKNSEILEMNRGNTKQVFYLLRQLLSGISQSDGQPKLGNHRNTQRLEKLESLDEINDKIQKETGKGDAIFGKNTRLTLAFQK